ncbi:hypothetical protein [Staphylococcus hominis]|uniref:hypothetical protein n=1 Tax=Staphylococcus hominis TaxID=1290 RepID=UPI0034CE3425
MFLEKLKCSHCEKEIDKNENITIHTNSKNLNGVTNLKSWAKNQNVYVKNAQNKKEPVFRLFLSIHHIRLLVFPCLCLTNK